MRHPFHACTETHLSRTQRCRLLERPHPRPGHVLALGGRHRPGDVLVALLGCKEIVHADHDRLGVQQPQPGKQQAPPFAAALLRAGSTGARSRVFVVVVFVVEELTPPPELQQSVSMPDALEDLGEEGVRKERKKATSLHHEEMLVYFFLRRLPPGNRRLGQHTRTTRTSRIPLVARRHCCYSLGARRQLPFSWQDPPATWQPCLLFARAVWPRAVAFTVVLFCCRLEFQNGFLGVWFWRLSSCAPFYSQVRRADRGIKIARDKVLVFNRILQTFDGVCTTHGTRTN